MLVSCKPFVVLLADEFNRVIIPVKRGEENTDYVNASFIDVSDGLCPMSVRGASVPPSHAYLRRTSLSQSTATQFIAAYPP